MNKSEQINELAGALSLAQGELKNAPTLNVNPFYKSKYADLATVIDTAKPVLAKHGLSIVQAAGGNGAISITTILMHKSGQWIESEISFTPDKADIQKAGAVLTYLRRYSYAAIIGISSEEDDDGNTVKPEQQAPPKKETDLETARAATVKHLDATAGAMVLGKPEMFKEEIKNAKTPEDLRAIYKDITEAGKKPIEGEIF